MENDLEVICDFTDHQTGEYYKINPKKKLIYYHHTFDGTLGTNEILQYKLEESEIIIRTIDKFFYNLSEIFYSIKDNVILELNIKNECDKNPDRDFKDEMIKSKHSIDWKSIENIHLRLLTLAQHSDIFDDIKFRKIVRTELERLKLGKSKFDKFASSFSCIISDDNIFTKYQLPKETEELRKEQFISIFKKPTEYAISVNELTDYKRTISFLTFMLEENLRPTTAEI